MPWSARIWRAAYWFAIAEVKVSETARPWNGGGGGWSVPVITFRTVFTLVPVKERPWSQVEEGVQVAAA